MDGRHGRPPSIQLLNLPSDLSLAVAGYLYQALAVTGTETARRLQRSALRHLPIA
jgi:hypothetical protein